MNSVMHTSPVASSAIPHIRVEEVQHYAGYFDDLIARLFCHDGKLHLGILLAHTTAYQQFYASPLFESLVADRPLAGLEACPLSIEGMHIVYSLDQTPVEFLFAALNGRKLFTCDPDGRSA